MIGNLGQRLDRVGLRRPIALAASAIYGLRSGGRQRFSVDRDGRWVNQQPEATMVSATIHTARFDDYRDQVLENWAWQYRPKPGDVVLDVGAGIGEEAVVFSKLVGDEGKVISIEAHPQTFRCLEQTIARSGLNAVVALPYAVADQDGIVHIGALDNHLANTIMAGSSVGQEVPARRLDTIADELALGEIALLKMNIEGAERLAVRGMEGLARRLRHVAVSCHDFINDRDGGEEFRTVTEVRAALERLGFAIETRSDHPDPWVRYYLYGTNKALA